MPRPGLDLMGDADLPDLPDTPSTSDARPARWPGIWFDGLDPDPASFADA